jgi:xanthine dehydrogenase molybdenum-binding subunit
MKSIRAREVLEAALQAAQWESGYGGPDAGNGQRSADTSGQAAGPRRGRGLALFGRMIGGGAGGSVITAQPDGSLTVVSPTVDQGCGTHTIVQQMVATEFGVPLERVRVAVGNTDTAPYDEGPRASRVTYTEGGAVLQACGELRQRLTEPAARLLDCSPQDVAYRDGAFWGQGRQVSLAEVVAQAEGGRPVTVTVALVAENVEDVSYFCAQVADVEVDPETGQVRLERLVTAHDVGTIINSLAHQGQIEGAAVTGIGLALTEELVMEDGRITNPNLGEYKLPTVADLPELETVLVPSAGGTGPYEAKAIGEYSNNNPPAAIANAVADAVGAHLFELPITAERVYRAMQARPSS